MVYVVDGWCIWKYKLLVIVFMGMYIRVIWLLTTNVYVFFLGEPSKEPFLKHQPFASEDGMKLGDVCREELGEPSTEPSKKDQRFAPNKPRRQTCQFARRPLIRPKTPKLAHGRQMERSAKKRWGTLHGTISEMEAICPKERQSTSLPRNLYHGWRPQSYCCWEKGTSCNTFQLALVTCAQMISTKLIAKKKGAWLHLLPVKSSNKLLRSFGFGLISVASSFYLVLVFLLLPPVSN